ncbi:MAG: hypothetical protein ABFD54_03315 [Armatimonadota bacterium]|nr:hypothetical protein [bacterium]
MRVAPYWIISIVLLGLYAPPPSFAADYAIYDLGVAPSYDCSYKNVTYSALSTNDTAGMLTQNKQDTCSTSDIVPEPSSIVSALIGFAGLALRAVIRRRTLTKA